MTVCSHKAMLTIVKGVKYGYKKIESWSNTAVCYKVKMFLCFCSFSTKIHVVKPFCLDAGNYNLFLKREFKNSSQSQKHAIVNDNF